MSWPIHELHIEQYRGIRGLVLSQLGQVNILVGGNNSGKTSVLEALWLHGSPQDPWTWLTAASLREPFPSVRRAPVIERLRWLFPQDVGASASALYEGQIRIGASGTFMVRRFAAGFRELRGTHPAESEPPKVRSGPPEQLRLMVEDAPAGDEADVGVERHGAEIDVEVDVDKSGSGNIAEDPGPRYVFRLWEDERFASLMQQIGPTLPVKIIRPSDHWLRTLPAQRFSEARLGGFEQSIVDLLKSLDPRISGAEVLAPRRSEPVLYLRDSSAGLLPLSAFGDGLRRVLVIALALPSVSGGVLLIDELETAIHASALAKVFRWMLDACRQYQVQLFVTTHSLEAVDAMLEADTTPEEDIVGYRLERVDDTTAAKRYGEDLLKRLRYERGLDVR